MERNLLLLVFFCCSLLQGKEQFVFSARTSSHNQTAFYDHINLSPLMHMREHTSRVLCHWEAKKPLHVSTLAFLQAHQERLWECFSKEGVLVYDRSEHTLNLGASHTDMLLLPVRFTVEFKDDFVTLYLLAP